MNAEQAKALRQDTNWQELQKEIKALEAYCVEALIHADDPDTALRQQQSIKVYRQIINLPDTIVSREEEG